MSATHWFNTVARKASFFAGSPWSFGTAVAIVVLWGVTGPLFGFADTWQLVINTGTTIITFLMVFLIQHSQNADTAALQIKLDELIRVNRYANNQLLDLEELEEKELERLRAHYEQMARKAREVHERRRQG